MEARIVFFGTPEFAATILEDLISFGAHVALVVTRPDKPRGRNLESAPPPVKQVAEAHHLPLAQPIKVQGEEFLATLKELDADLFIVAAFSEIFREPFLKMPRLGCINVHPSLLPKYRGAAPIERALMAGEKRSGVTIMALNPLVDAGDMLAVEEVDVGPDETAGELAARFAKLGSKLLWQVIKKIEAGKLERQVQNSSEATLAPKLKPEDEVVRWNRSAREIHNQIRALSPRPGSYAWVNVRGVKRRLLIKKAALELSREGKAGQILDEPGLVVAAEQGALRLLTVQLEGKKALSAEEFLRGIPKNELEFIL